MSHKTDAIVHYGTQSSSVPKTWTQSLPVIICVLIPSILLVGAYLHMVFYYKKLWLFNTVVHENGKYTLLETIFYFRHFCWEILGKAVYSLFIVGAFYYYGKPNAALNKNEEVNIPKRRIAISGILLLSLVLLSIIMAANKFGLREALLGFFQYRASELRPLYFGSHWRNHFLSNIVLFCTSAAFIMLYRIVSSKGYWVKRRFWTLLPISSAIFVFLTFFFGLTVDPFETPSYLGHQLREVFGTDLSITMFLTLGVLIYLEGKYNPGEEISKTKGHSNRTNKLFHLLSWSLPAIIITIFLIVKVLALDISANIANLGNTRYWSLLDLFAWHFFEHSLDYLFVVTLVYFIYTLTLKREFRRFGIEK